MTFYEDVKAALTSVLSASTIRLFFRRGTAAQWSAANPILGAGEPGYETDTKFEKRGDGSTAWADLPYLPNAAQFSNKVSMPTVDVPVGSTLEKMPNGSVAYVLNRPRSVHEFATSDGTVLGGVELNTAIASVADGTVLVIPDRTTIDVESTQIVYNHPMTLMSDWRGGVKHSGHPSGAGHLVRSSGVAFRGVKIQGSSAGTYVASEHGIYVLGVDNGAGVAPTMLTDIELIDVDVTGFGSVAVQSMFVDGMKVRGATLRQCGYGGIIGLNSLHVQVENFRVRDVAPGTSSNEYAIQATSLGSTDDLVRYPLSKFWEVSNGEISNVLDWDGIGCHAAQYMVVSDVVFDGVQKPIEFVGLKGGDGTAKYAPKFCRASDIVADSGTRSGTIRPGFAIAGAQGAGRIGSPAEYAESCALENITLVGFGDPTSDINGGIYIRTSRNASIRSIKGVECGSAVVDVYYDNLNYQITDVSGVDTWASTELNNAPVIRNRSQNNTGLIDHVSVIAGTRPASGSEIRNTHGVYMSSNDAGTSVQMGQTNDMSASTIAPTGGGGLAKLVIPSVQATDVQQFTASGTWTKPSGAKMCHVRLWGGSGGSGSGARMAAGILATGGASGGTGGYTERWIRAADISVVTVSVTVGAAGTSGAAVTTDSTVGNPGTSGGGSSLTGPGGNGGVAGSFGASGGGGGASRNGNNSGAGGPSAPGLCIVETYF